jgi:hypothetical protein
MGALEIWLTERDFFSTEHQTPEFDAIWNWKNGADGIFSTKRTAQNITVMCLHQSPHPAAGSIASILGNFYYIHLRLHILLRDW